MPENESEASSDDLYESDGDDEETPPSPSPHTFTIMANPFSDHRPGTVPALVEDFSGVHPDISWDNISALECFQLFMSNEVVESLCLWTDVRAAKFFVDNPTISSKKFMGRKWLYVTKEEMNVFLCLQLLMGVTKLPKISDYWSNY